MSAHHFPSHPTPLLATSAIIEVFDQSKKFQGILLIERKYPPFGYALPGGLVEIGETVEQAIKREIQEETGVSLFDLKQFHVFSDPNRDPRGHVVDVTFHAKTTSVPHSGDDASKVHVVKPKQIIFQDLAFDHGEILQRFFLG